MAAAPRFLALVGGVGGAKLADGLARALAPGQLTVAVNTADDFVHLGLEISPDLDTVLYTLAGRSDADRGWGLADERWTVMAALEALGGETWFRLGDRDIATHLLRTQALRDGASLSEVTERLCRKMGVLHRVVPMSDQKVATIVRSEEGSLPFQDYFVRRGCAPAVTGFVFDGLAEAAPSPGLAECLRGDGLAAVLIGPSNPYVSIAPIIGLPAVSEFLSRRTVPVIAVSPIVGGAALKGPAAKMMAELGVEVSPAGIADHYGTVLDGLVIDEADAALAGPLEARGLAVRTTKTVMRGAEDRHALARTAIEFAAEIAPRQQ